MITELTKEQEGQLEVYKDKWIDVGLLTNKDGKADRPMAEKMITKLYKAKDFKKPKFMWEESPFAIIEFLKKDGHDVSGMISSFCFGNGDASWLGFYQFFQKEVGLDFCDELDYLIDLATKAKCGWWLPFENYCFCSEKPEAIHLNEANQLHKDGDMALKYSDGFGIYSLNGVKVSKKIAVTPAMELDAKKALLEKNVEIRRELIRKIGIERVLEQNDHEVVDTWDDYELLLLDVGLESGEKAKYLKMKNPSIGTYHVEGVHPECISCKSALNWRNGCDDPTNEDYEKPETLT